MTYEAYVVSRTSTRPQVDSATMQANQRFDSGMLHETDEMPAVESMSFRQLEQIGAERCGADRADRSPRTPEIGGAHQRFVRVAFGRQPGGLRRRSAIDFLSEGNAKSCCACPQGGQSTNDNRSRCDLVVRPLVRERRMRLPLKWSATGPGTREGVFDAFRNPR